MVCDCRLLWLFDVRNRTRSGVIQKSLDNLNCDLQEGDQKPEQVYLLRLHYENFKCQPTIQTSPIQRPEILEKIHSVSSRADKGPAMGRIQIVVVAILIIPFIKLLFSSFGNVWEKIIIFLRNSWWFYCNKLLGCRLVDRR